MNCELMGVATEIILDEILNTTVHYLSNSLASIGIGVTHRCTVGENKERLIDVLVTGCKR